MTFANSSFDVKMKATVFDYAFLINTTMSKKFNK